MGGFSKYTPVASDLPVCDAFAAWWSKAAVDDCLAEIGSYLGVKHLYAVSSGRAALYAILKARLAPGSKVVLPGYTCYTLAAAVVRAGMKPVLSDSRKSDLGYDLDKLRETLTNHPDARAVVVCHLFGILLDIDEIKSIAGPGVLIVDDAAQAYGIKIGDRFAGTCGDAGFYSFGRGKNLSIVGGGLLVTDDDKLAAKLNSLIEDEFRPTKNAVGELIRAKSYNFVVRPMVFNIVSRLPGVHLGRSVYFSGFGVSRLSDYKARLLYRIHRLAERINAARSKVCDRYMSMLDGNDSIIIPKSAVDKHPGSLRFVILVEDADRRLKILTESNRHGWGLSGMYPTALNQIGQLPDLKAYPIPEAESIAGSIITLPTHRFIDPDGGVIKKIAGLLS